MNSFSLLTVGLVGRTCCTILVATLSLILACDNNGSIPTQQPATVTIELNSTTESGSFVVNELDVNPVEGSVFEDLLKRLPDNQVTRGYTVLGDFAGVIDALGIRPLPMDATAPERKEYVSDAILIEVGGFRPPFPAWPVELQPYQRVVDQFPNLAFDSASVSQFAYAGTQGFMSTGPPISYDVALGDFSYEATAAALSACQCDSPEIREYSEVEYFAWGEGDGIGDLSRRLELPLYDHQGRGPHLLVRDGDAFYSVLDGAINDHIDVFQGTTSSLLEAGDYVNAVQRFVAMGTIREITLRNRGFTLVEATDLLGDKEPARESIESSPLLAPFRMAALAEGFDGQRPFTGIFIAHEDSETATINAERLIVRLKEGFALRGLKWSEIVDRIDIQIDENILLARMYMADPSQIHFNLLFGNTLLVHQ